MRYTCRIIWLAALAVMALLSGCRSDTFTIEGTAKGGGTQNLRAIFFADGAMQNVPASMVDGKFSLDGRSSEPTVVSLYLSDKSLLGRVIVSNGETVKGTFVKGDPYDVTLKGNKDSEAYADFIRSNRETLAGGRVEQINNLISNYIISHTGSIASTALLVTLYDADSDPSGALALFDKIDPDARPSSISEGFAESAAMIADLLKKHRVMPIRYYGIGDSLSTFNPKGAAQTLLAFTSQDTGRDSVVAELRRIARGIDRGKVRILEISSDADSMVWRHSIRRDSATWTQGWLPAALMSQGVDILGVSRLPYFILVDSTGRQLARVSSAKDLTVAGGRVKHSGR